MTREGSNIFSIGEKLIFSDQADQK